MSDRNTPATTFNNNELYRGIRIVGRQLGPEGSDWALVQLDRPVLNHPSVRIRRRGKISEKSAVHVIGHPSGLPKKYAGNAAVRENDERRYFKANLDTYGGNSGSPVFNSTTHEVEGILVRGETDFVQLEGCNVSNVCPENGCNGEDCTRTTEFASLVPEWTQDCIPFSGGSATVEQISGSLENCIQWYVAARFWEQSIRGGTGAEYHPILRDEWSMFCRASAVLYGVLFGGWSGSGGSYGWGRCDRI